MGLDISHDCWHGSYVSFGQWRKRLATSIGIDLESMEGFVPEWKKDVVPTSWESLPPHPLHILLHHSDCDGSIHWRKALPLAEALEARPMDGCAQTFAKGLRKAYAEKKSVLFR